MAFNPTISENLRRVKEVLDIKTYLEFKGYTFKSNRTKCPFCNNETQAFTLMNNNNRFNCLKCGQKGDILDLEVHFSGQAAQYAINNLIQMTNIKRYIGSYSKNTKEDIEEAKKELEFIKESTKHLKIISEKLDMLKMLNYDILEYELIEEIELILNLIEIKSEQAKLHKFDKQELRDLYTHAKKLCIEIENLKNK